MTILHSEDNPFKWKHFAGEISLDREHGTHSLH